MTTLLVTVIAVIAIITLLRGRRIMAQQYAEDMSSAIAHDISIRTNVADIEDDTDGVISHTVDLRAGRAVTSLNVQDRTHDLLRHTMLAPWEANSHKGYRSAVNQERALKKALKRASV